MLPDELGNEGTREIDAAEGIEQFADSWNGATRSHPGHAAAAASAGRGVSPRCCDRFM